MGIFVLDSSNQWQLLENSNVVTLTDPTEDPYRRIAGTGLNASLLQNTAYQIAIRNLSTTPWSYASFTPSGSLTGTTNNSAKLCTLRATSALDTYTNGTAIDLSHIDYGHGKRPWFRVSQ